MKRRNFSRLSIFILLAMMITGIPLTPNAAGLQANIWYVAIDGSDLFGDGTEENPFASIQHGIDTANHGDTVIVFPGVYKENINYSGKNIIVSSLFLISGEEDYILQTVIDGTRSDHVVTIMNSETNQAELSGFTITHGHAQSDLASEPHGGGIFCQNSNPSLNHLIVTGNQATYEGGGLYFAHCAPIAKNVIVTNNLAGTGGGGIRYSYGSVHLENIIIANNLARSDAGGMQLYHADGTIENALIANNSGGAKGGGLQFDGSSPTFINASIVGNWTSGHGGGVNISYISQPVFSNSIIWGNSPEQIYFDTDWPGQAITVEHSDIQGGKAGIITNSQGPVYWGNGNLDSSPDFVKTSMGNFHLSNKSPCIGAGNIAGSPSADIEGNPRPNPIGSTPDMGAYESPLNSALNIKIHLPTIIK